MPDLLLLPSSTATGMLVAVSLFAAHGRSLQVFLLAVFLGLLTNFSVADNRSSSFYKHKRRTLLSPMMMTMSKSDDELSLVISRTSHFFRQPSARSSEEHNQDNFCLQ